MNVTELPPSLEARTSRPWSVDAALVARLSAALPQTQAEEAWLAERFYGGLFAAHPALRPMFPADMTQQTAKLVASMRVVLASVTRPNEVLRKLGALGRSHATWGAQPEHYPIVCERLADALAELRGGDAELREQWFDVLQRVSAAMLATT